MPFTILPFILILAGAVIASVILIRKFPQIALLDVDKLPQEVQSQKKKAIIEEQYKRSMKKTAEKLKKWSGPMHTFWTKTQKKFRDRVQKTYVQYAKSRAKKPKKSEKAPPPEAIAALLKDAQTQLLMENYKEAEQKYIEVIRFAPRTVEAYRGLGRLYFAKKQWDEARETYLFIVKLDEKDGRAHNRLGMIAVETEDWKTAVAHFKRAVEIDNKIALRHYDLAHAYDKMGKQLYALRSYERAVSLEPLNPKYLDAYLKTAILLKNKELAQAAYDQLKIANPENKKLDQLRRTIEEL